MANFEMYFTDAEREAAANKDRKPIVCGKPSKEEEEQAFEHLAEGSEYFLNKIMTGRFI